MSVKGSAILLAARTKFRAARSQETLRKIEVPEWDCSIHFWPEMSVDEKRRVFRHMRSGPTGGVEIALDSMLSASVDQVLCRARDEFGDRLFTDDDETALLDTAPDVLQRIASQMGYGASPTLEEAEKN